MSYSDDLTSARDNIAARLAAITADQKPSYNIDGQEISWTEYQRMLIEGLSRLQRLIDADGGPYAEDIQGFTDPAYGA